MVVFLKCYNCVSDPNKEPIPIWVHYGAFTLIFDVIFFWKVILSIIFSNVFFRHK